MNVKTWIETAKKQIDSLDAELIALKVFAPKRADRSWLVAHGDQEIDNLAKKADKMVLDRQRKVPLAYILGEKEFYGRSFAVDSGVLIPRPETENLIDTIKTLDLPKQPKFLEIGTGSGCIAITLALEYPQSQVLATDLSEKALTVADYNNHRHEGRIGLLQSNLFRDLDFEHLPEHFDVVVANLPYVNREWDWLDLDGLKYEPTMALYVRGNNGLSLYQRFFKELNYQQNTNSLWLDYVVVEADPCQHRALIQMAQKVGFYHVRTDGFSLLFEDSWRYWWDAAEGKYLHKPKEIIEKELETGVIHWIPEQLGYE